MLKNGAFSDIWVKSKYLLACQVPIGIILRVNPIKLKTHIIMRQKNEWIRGNSVLRSKEI
jgi:hypothetical protein